MQIHAICVLLFASSVLSIQPINGRFETETSTTTSINDVDADNSVYSEEDTPSSLPQIPENIKPTRCFSHPNQEIDSVNTNNIDNVEQPASDPIPPNFETFVPPNPFNGPVNPSFPPSSNPFNRPVDPSFSPPAIPFNRPVNPGFAPPPSSFNGPINPSFPPSPSSFNGPMNPSFLPPPSPFNGPMNPSFPPPPFSYRNYYPLSQPMVPRPIPGMPFTPLQRFSFPGQNSARPLVIVKLLQPIILPVARPAFSMEGEKSSEEIDNERFTNSVGFLRGRGFNRNQGRRFAPERYRRFDGPMSMKPQNFGPYKVGNEDSIQITVKLH